MTIRRATTVRLALLAVAVLAACGTVTRIPIAWRNPVYEGGPFRKIFVIGVGEAEASRRLFENRLTAAFSAGAEASVPSYRLLPSSERLSEEQIREAIDGGGFDGVVVSRLLGVEEETSYIPPRSYVVPRAYHGYYSYYATSWDVVHQPGYTETRTIVLIETNLYAVESGALIWSGHSETFDPGSVEQTIDSVTQAVARRLREERLIP